MMEKQDLKKLAEDAVERIRPRFGEIDAVSENCTRRVMAAFRNHRVSEACFAGSTGYGYDDLGRETLEKVWAEVFGTESALVRLGFMNGTHAITCAVFAPLRTGDTLLCATGLPYDTLWSALGVHDDKPGSLRSYGIGFKAVELLSSGEPDWAAIEAAAADPGVKEVFIQRSRGYTARPALDVETIDKIIDLVHRVNPNAACVVDNCYGEFTEEREPRGDLLANGEQKAMAAIDIAADSYADHQLNYTLTSSGIQCAYLEVEDVPITFDNRLYFTYNVSDATNVTVIYQDKPNPYLTALYAKDSVFSTTIMPAGKIDYERLRSSAIVVMSEVENVSSGLADELTHYVENGGSLLVLPSAKMDIATWNGLLGSLNCSQYGTLTAQELKIGSINTESAYFKGSLQGNGERLDFPTAKQYFTFANPHIDEAVMTFENTQPALFVNYVGNGRVILSAVAANDDFGNIHKHALFFIPMHNIGIRSVMQQKLYNVIGKDHSQAVAKSMEGREDVLSLKLQGGESEYIPEQRNLGNETMLFFNDQLDEAGIYDVMLDGARQTAVAFNYDRRESQLKYYTEEEIEAFIKEQGDSAHIELIDAATKDITQNVAETLHGHALWRWFILLALILLAAEVAILRLWK